MACAAVLVATEGCLWPIKRVALPPQPPPVAELSFTGPDEGWPPSVKGITNTTEVPWREIPGSLTDDLEIQIRNAALQDERVRSALGNRFAYISTDALEPRKGQSPSVSKPIEVRVTFYSHHRNVAVEIYMSGRKVREVVARKGYQPPEGQEEIKAAISLAQRDDRLAGSVRGLYAYAIVLVPAPGQPGYGQRVLHVTFFANEDKPRYSAQVDLTAQKVLFVR